MLHFNLDSAPIDITRLILCESIAPFLAIISSRAYFGKRVSIVPIFKLSVPTAIALTIIGQTTSHNDPPSTFGWLAAAVVCVGFTASQTSARVLSTQRNADWVIPRLASMNALVLIATTALLPSDHLLMVTGAFLPLAVSAAFVVAIGIFATQKLFIAGLKGTPEWTSGPLIATSVPIAIVSDHVFFGREVSDITLALAGAYIISTLAVSWGSRRDD
jgi:hypothetical protein